MTETGTPGTLLLEMIEAVAERVETEREYLTELDSQIGDADFGVNLARGLDAVLTELDGVDPDDPAPIVETTGMTILDEMAGSSGVLIGGGLLKASDRLETDPAVDDVVAAADAYVDHVEEKGDVELGDKTMYDALRPAITVLTKALTLDDADPLTATAQSVEAARRGAQFTTPLQAKKGRASYVESRSVGHPDPGAVFVAMVFEEVFEVLRAHRSGDVEPHLDDRF